MIYEHGTCSCGATYSVPSTEFAEYARRDPNNQWGQTTEHRNTDTFNDGETLMWDCPFCGLTEVRR